MKKRVLFVNDEMVMGGVARILITMLNKINPNDYEVDVLILHPHGELYDHLPSWVHVIPGTSFFDAVDVNLKEAWHHHRYLDVFKKLSLLAQMKYGTIEGSIRKQRTRLGLDQSPYDVEIAAKEGFCTIFVAQGLSKRKLNWIHVDYSAQNYSAHHMSLMKRSLEKIDFNIAVSLKAAQAFKDLFGTANIATINNPIDIEALKKASMEPCEVKLDADQLNLITVARFHPQKAVDRLLKAFANMHYLNPKTHLYLLGSGPLENELKTLTKMLNLTNSVSFLGQKANPMPYIKQADLFVLSSLYEGYPTTVIESFVAQTPVLSTNVSGVHEQIQEGLNGWIIDNTQEALTQKLSELAFSKNLLKTMKSNLQTYRYDNHEIVTRFEKALNGETL